MTVWRLGIRICFSMSALLYRARRSYPIPIRTSIHLGLWSFMSWGPGTKASLPPLLVLGCFEQLPGTGNMVRPASLGHYKGLRCPNITVQTSSRSYRASCTLRNLTPASIPQYCVGARMRDAPWLQPRACTNTCSHDSPQWGPKIHQTKSLSARAEPKFHFTIRCSDRHPSHNMNWASSSGRLCFTHPTRGDVYANHDKSAQI
ncbi:hypothetical protein B0T10DRAFT_484034 [Thelonectria olida]|uniref:Uncharacterized protein n=1 Tax=Thelonectria olida TaxID=1576542 RepID=A0A9P9AR93_9HYPO|nr:hypothetical protein B0T10DRAFT_484034 [Thelonectria olida]